MRQADAVPTVTLPVPVMGFVLILPGSVVIFPVVALLPVAGLVSILPGSVLILPRGPLPRPPLLLPPLVGLNGVPLAGSVTILDGIGLLPCAPR